MNRTDFAVKLKVMIDEVRKSFYDPGYDDHLKYREALARHRGLVSALEELRITEDEDEER